MQVKVPPLFNNFTSFEAMLVICLLLLTIHKVYSSQTYKQKSEVIICQAFKAYLQGFFK